MTVNEYIKVMKELQDIAKKFNWEWDTLLDLTIVANLEPDILLAQIKRYMKGTK